MSWWEALLLGLIQGLTEFIPVSSSGHLVLGEHWLGLQADDNLTFVVFVHFGTILSILTVYWNRVTVIVTDTVGALARPSAIPESYHTNQGFRTAMMILVTIVPTAVAYVLFRNAIGDAFNDPRFVAWMLFATGTILLLTLLARHNVRDVGPVRAFLIGAAQSLALLPGISRSGTTISTALYLKIDRERAANFSFLMLLPVVLGATFIEAIDMMRGGIELEEGIPLFIGTLTAYLSGIWAIRLVVVFTKENKLPYFAAYCYAIAALHLMIL